MFTVDASMALRDSGVVQFSEVGAVAFHMIDPLDGETARGDWGGEIGGVVRPKLDWTTEYEPAPQAESAAVSDDVIS